MTRVISLAGQIFDQMRDSRQRPQVGFIAALHRAGEERSTNRLQLRRREAGLAAGRPSALETVAALGLLNLVPVMGGLSANPEPASHFGWIDSLFKEFSGLKAPLFHRRVIALLTHAAITLHSAPTLVSLLYESQ